MASAFAGILAFGVSHMNGLGNLGPTYGQHYGPSDTEPDLPYGIESGIAGWRWIVRHLCLTAYMFASY